MSPVIRPASWYRRLAAYLVDLSLLATALFSIARHLPKGPPPADAMAFYSPQDFTNYFTLAGSALAITAAYAGLLFLKHIRATPGQLIVGLKLVCLDGTEPTQPQVLKRWVASLASISFITVPGPLIALFIGLITAFALRVPFTTADRLLTQTGLPDTVRYALHGLSFLALFAALWIVAIHPAIKYFEEQNEGLTMLDRWTGTTVSVRSGL